jgi:hypothetical protein
MMACSGDICYFNSSPTVGPPGHTWRPRTYPGQAAGAGAAGHVAVLELPRAASGSWSRRTRGDPGAAPGWAAGVGAAGHVAAPVPTSAGRRGPELQLAWQCVYTRPAPCLDLELVCGVPGLQSTDNKLVQF